MNVCLFNPVISHGTQRRCYLHDYCYIIFVKCLKKLINNQKQKPGIPERWPCVVLLFSFFQNVWCLEILIKKTGSPHMAMRIGVSGKGPGVFLFLFLKNAYLSGWKCSALGRFKKKNMAAPQMPMRTGILSLLTHAHGNWRGPSLNPLRKENDTYLISSRAWTPLLNLAWPNCVECDTGWMAMLVLIRENLLYDNLKESNTCKNCEIYILWKKGVEKFWKSSCY